ncbi:unnamed protein product [Moneuplotes crassus]|uniref:Tubulin-tyrosine ligase family protein n=1 Tax=Euplotes crassus TaxID=5936 RepID=A0AAD1Y2E1_EUPCR|nr:unnamed protein product [Moneuplotes crassus]
MRTRVSVFLIFRQADLSSLTTRSQQLGILNEIERYRSRAMRQVGYFKQWVKVQPGKQENKPSGFRQNKSKIRSIQQCLGNDLGNEQLNIQEYFISRSIHKVPATHMKQSAKIEEILKANKQFTPSKAINKSAEKSTTAISSPLKSSILNEPKYKASSLEYSEKKNRKKILINRVKQKDPNYIQLYIGIPSKKKSIQSTKHTKSKIFYPNKDQEIIFMQNPKQNQTTSQTYSDMAVNQCLPPEQSIIEKEHFDSFLKITKRTRACQSIPLNSTDPQMSSKRSVQRFQPNYYLNKYHGEEKVARKKDSKFAAAYFSHKFKYVIAPGNNSKLIREVMKQRSWWIEIPNYNSLYNFKWQPFSKGIKFEDLDIHTLKRVVNHLEGHPQLSQKRKMFENIRRYCQIIKANCFDFVPLTYCIDVDTSSTNCINGALSEFSAIFNIFEKNKKNIQELPLDEQGEIKNEFLDRDLTLPPPSKDQPNLLPTKIFNLPSKGGGSGYIIPTMPLSHFSGSNFWILKAINLNRGRCIHVFNSLQELKKILKQYSLGDSKREQPFEAIYSQPQSTEPSSKPSSVKNKVKKVEMKSFVIQKYIERPFLIHDRKFDIRLWVLVSHTGKCHFFKEGYLRTSATKFSMDDSNPDDPHVHLTNNAIQKSLKGYGQFEDGNQLSFKQFQEYLDSIEDCNVDFKRDCLPQIKNIIRHTLLAARKQLNNNKGRLGFEFFGFDFMLDADFNAWLIEVNTNPCIEESSEMLKHYLRRMIDDMMKLELDPLFPKPTKPKKATPKSRRGKITHKRLSKLKET